MSVIEDIGSAIKKLFDRIMHKMPQLPPGRGESNYAQDNTSYKKQQAVNFKESIKFDKSTLQKYKNMDSTQIANLLVQDIDQTEIARIAQALYSNGEDVLKNKISNEFSLSDEEKQKIKIDGNQRDKSAVISLPKNGETINFYANSSSNGNTISGEVLAVVDSMEYIKNANVSKIELAQYTDLLETLKRAKLETKDGANGICLGVDERCKEAILNNSLGDFARGLRAIKDVEDRYKEADVEYEIN